MSLHIVDAQEQSDFLPGAFNTVQQGDPLHCNVLVQEVGWILLALADDDQLSKEAMRTSGALDLLVQLLAFQPLGPTLHQFLDLQVCQAASSLPQHVSFRRPNHPPGHGSLHGLCWPSALAWQITSRLQSHSVHGIRACPCDCSGSK